MNKRSFKALLSVLLALVMVLGIAPMAVSAEGATVTAITSADQLVTGQYVIATKATNMAMGKYEGGWVLATEVAPADGVLSNVAEDLLWTITVDGTSVVLTDAAGTMIAPKGGNSNGIKNTDTEYKWTVSFADGAFSFAGVGDDTVTLASNPGSAGKFRGYKNGTIANNPEGYPSNFVLYKVGGEAPAEPVTATISFADVANRTSQDTESQVWEQNGITVTNNKGTSTSNVADYSNPARFYMNSELVIAFPGMMQIDVTCKNASYATALVNSISDENATVTANEKVVTIVLTEAVDTFTVAALSAQVRVDSITVSNTVTAGETPEVPKTEEPEVPADPTPDTTLTILEALALGATKAHNTYTEGKYYVVGEITEVYNAQYGNMRIKDAEGNILTVYGTYSADGETRYDALETKPVAGDTVKVYGIIGQYSNTAQMKNGWIVEHTPGETAPETTETPADPTPDTVLTIEEAITLGASKAHNTYTEGKYYVTGVITEVYNTQYGNMKITDAAGNILTVYGTYSADGETRYDALETKPVVGDTVKIYGIVGQYNGTAQIKNGWIAEHTPAAPETTEPETTPAPTGDVIAVVAVLAVIALAGALLISKKRSYQN